MLIHAPHVSRQRRPVAGPALSQAGQWGVALISHHGPGQGPVWNWLPRNPAHGRTLPGVLLLRLPGRQPGSPGRTPGPVARPLSWEVSTQAGAGLPKLLPSVV